VIGYPVPSIATLGFDVVSSQDVVGRGPVAATHPSMRGIEKALSNTGCPWPGGAEVTFDQEDVVQIGKLYCWGSSCVQFIVRLRSGQEVFVRADKQDKIDERFLRKIAKPIRGWSPGKAEGFRTVWGARRVE